MGSDNVVCSEITHPYVPCFPLAEFLWWLPTEKKQKTENRKPPGRQGAGDATFNAGVYPVDSVRIPFNALFSPDWNNLTAAQGALPPPRLGPLPSGASPSAFASLKVGGASLADPSE